MVKMVKIVFRCQKPPLYINILFIYSEQNDRFGIHFDQNDLDHRDPGRGQVHVGDNGKAVVAEGETKYEVKMLVESVGAVRDLFWGDSSMAVIFGVCRDCFKYADNMSQFERDFGCSEGLISNTMRNNPYMRLAVDKWEQQGAKQRVLRLVDEYKKAVSARLKQPILTE